MNNYCNNCKFYCEELIPTYNCNFQMEKENSLNDLCNNFISNIKNYINEIKHKSEYKLKELSYEERSSLYINEFDLGTFSSKIDDKLILISLICSFALTAKSRNPNITVLDCVKTLTDYEKMNDSEKILGSNKYYENLAVICESFLGGVTEGNTFGLKNAVELKAKVKEILASQTPF